jgi:hypothetical protein
MDKNVQQASPFQGLQAQLEITQQMVLMVAEEQGSQAAVDLMEKTIARLDPFHAAVLRGLMGAMCATSMGEAGETVH